MSQVEPTTRCNLLFGLLAVQLDFISPDALAEALRIWISDKTTPLAEILREQGVLDADTLTLLEAVVKKHVAIHGNDWERSLAAVTSSSAEEKLRDLPDADLNATLS